MIDESEDGITKPQTNIKLKMEVLYNESYS